MPRLFTRTNRPQTDERIRRSHRYQALGYKAWVDPFPGILGTRPEKIIYNELIERRIPFMYQTWHHAELSRFNFDKWYRPDFLLPTLKIVIEVQGFYWHSKPQQIEKDAFKFAVFQTLGYKILAWWDFEIEANVDVLFSREPLLAHYSGKRGGELITKNKATIDDSAGVRKANQNRTDYSLQAVRYGSRSNKKYRSYNVGA